jgi:hypothetical protein
MRPNLKIEDLPNATSSELYQLSWIIEQLLADPDGSRRRSDLFQVEIPEQNGL